MSDPVGKLEDRFSHNEAHILSLQFSSEESLHRRRRRAAGNGDSHAYHESHTVLEELTHIFHIGSMAILSILVAEVHRRLITDTNVHVNVISLYA